MKITSDITLEKFGSAINSSIFDASNIAGSLKQKELIDFTSMFPGPNAIAVTEKGKALLAEAEQKATSPFDSLDRNILNQLSKGKRNPEEIRDAISLNSKDLAMRLYKLSKQQQLTYEVKSGHVDILLTEQGFLKAAPQQSAAAQAIQQQGQQQAQPVRQAADQVQQQTAEVQAEIKAPASEIKLQPKPVNRRLVAVVSIAVIIIIIILVAVYLKY